MAANTVTPALDLSACRAIRSALLIGLESYGEIERIIDAYGVHADICGAAIPSDLRPQHPSGTADTVGRFAAALTFVDLLEDEIREAAEAGLEAGE